MTTGALLWFIAFGVSAAMFFGIALVVTYHGVGDLRALLRTTDRKKTRP